MKKVLLIIIDGLGDKPIKELGNRTPLEAAETPNFDFLAKNGVCGLMEPFMFPGQNYPTSDTTHLALLGFSPKKYYLGRGVYEAIGAGVPLKPGDIALRANFATVDKNLKIKDRRAGRIENTTEFVKALNKIKIKDAQIFVKKAFGHRAVIRIRSKNKLSSNISDNDPHKIGVKPKVVKPKNKTKGAEFTAFVLNQFLEKAHQILENHPLNKKRIKKGLLPANYLLARGAGSFREIPSFYNLFGLKAACIAGGTLYKGIGKALGMNLIKVKGANGKPNTNLKGKILTAKKMLKKYDFIFLHIKATDNLAEDGDFLGKKLFIEKIDKNLKYLLNLKNSLIIITCDHNTCCNLKRHCKGPVPIVIFGGPKDKVSKFSEKDCKLGGLKKFKAIALIKKLSNLQGK
jgi:2,3-bisphosphoglycerate-independent phosphoglycerate mutase